MSFIEVSFVTHLDNNSFISRRGFLEQPILSGTDFKAAK